MWIYVYKPSDADMKGTSRVPDCYYGSELSDWIAENGGLDEKFRMTEDQARSMLEREHCWGGIRSNY